MSARRIRAIIRKEIREYRRNRSVIYGMAILPLVFAIQPLVAVLRLSSGVSGALAHEHVLLYMLGIPTLVPVFVAAYSVAGERQQGTLEPALTTPIRGEEFLIGKALAALLPSLLIAYAVFGLFVGIVEVEAAPNVAAAVMQPADLLAQIVFTPLLACWTVWVAIAISTRSSDVRVAQQLGVLASLPPVFVTVMIALNVIEPTVELAIGCGALLILLDLFGWRLVSRLFDRERLISGTH
jgi:ABC-type transport system involved in multi-copper enzyme maturation permease subunit